MCFTAVMHRTISVHGCPAGWVLAPACACLRVPVCLKHPARQCCLYALFVALASLSHRRLRL